ncbi:MAG: S8 family serine peptidase [Xanthomonadaceae bacterium]|nr:S8 family serine peptidase [Xanthomonadaceae bacterium]
MKIQIISAVTVALSIGAVQASEGQILVKYKSSVPNVRVQSSAAASIQSVLGRAAVLSMRQVKTDASIHVVELDQSKDTDAAIQALKANPDVEIAEKNFRINMYQDKSKPAEKLPGTPNDELFSKQWGMQNIGQVLGSSWSKSTGTAGADINVSPLWAKGITGSQDIIVAVIDTGIDLTHPDLVGNIFVNKDEIPGNGIDDDNNGFIDDVNGWNFVDKNNKPSDDHDHGTHCSGVIGATGNDKVGVTGVNWKVRILPLKFLSAKGGGTLEGAIDAINYATMMNANIMSNSWGGGERSDLLFNAIKSARDKGILFVAAAGNDKADNDKNPHYPSNYELDNVIAVAAMDNKDNLASFSCYGKSTVHVAAPGVDVFSTVRGGKYGMMSGTSMACPHVAGVAALTLSQNPSLSYKELKQRLISGSIPVSNITGKVYAGGRVSAENTVRGL